MEQMDENFRSEYQVIQVHVRNGYCGTVENTVVHNVCQHPKAMQYQKYAVLDQSMYFM